MRCSWVKSAGLIGLVVVAGCSTADRGSGWLEGLRAREAQLPEMRMIGSDDGSFAAEVPAEMVGSVVEGTDADFVTFDIGGDSPIECALYHDEVESASTLQVAAEQVFSDLAERYDVGVKRQISKLDAGVVGPSPYLELHWQYQTEQPRGGVIGELKQMIANREGRSIYCVHHENGYASSFHRVFKALVESIRFAEYDQLRPYYTQVDVLSEGDRRSGFSIVTLTLDEDGDPRIVRYTTRIGIAADRVSARDVTEVEHSTVTGVLRGKLFTDYRDGGISSSLFLEDIDGSGWKVTGKRAGETLQTTFVEPRLASWLGEIRDYRRLILNDAAGRSTESKVWSPDVRADAGTVRSVKLLDRVDGDHYYAAAVQTGDVRSRVVVDEQGVPKSSRQSGRDVEISSERVYVEGSLR